MTAIIPPTNETQANELGWTVDRYTYPWCAYLGPRFAPEHIVEIDTPAWSDNGRRDAARHINACENGRSAHGG